jgi:catechol 2,3-dioxygenase-like lactoylglutathione lyase family enzyme
MKRFHVHVHVENLADSVRFYSALFGAQPEVRKPDYAKWMLEDPRLNFAISTGGARGVSHLGLQTDGVEELEAIAGRAQAAGIGGESEPEAECCYAKSTKHWFTDPQGLVWETFETHGASDSIGGCRVSPRSDTRDNAGCCG